jgi:type III secretion system FlhB-like substrate exporter
MEKAVAIKYFQDLPAPFIIAKGRGELAKKLMEIANEHDIKLIADPALAEKLIVLDVGDFIPEELYQIIAEILIFALRLGK